MNVENKMNNNIILRIIELSAPEQIILFGFQVQGTNNANSHINLLILIKHK